jgi:hypothetical protein
MYETPARSYDAQIGRFGQTDPLMESAANTSSYEFVLNNPVSGIDPTGLQTLQEMMQDAWDQSGEYGGYFEVENGRLKDIDGNGGSYQFGSQEEAFSVGVGWMDANNGWGQNGWASSLGEAKQNYFKLGGTEQSVWGVLPSVIVTATRQAGGGLNFGDAVWNWGDGNEDWRTDGYPYNYDGGTVQNWTNDKGGKYAVFKINNNGGNVIFQGVTITNFGVFNHTGFTTSNGAIHADNDFTLTLLEHEYGHYLQAKNYGAVTYNTVIVPASLYSIITDEKAHNSFWTEKDANMWAYIYFGKNSAIANDPTLPKQFSYLMDGIINHK